MLTKILMKYRFLIYIIIIFFLTGCRVQNDLVISNLFQNKLEEDGVKKSKILKMGDFSMLTYDVRDIEVTDEEIQQLFDDIIEFHNTLQEDKEKTTVEEGDFVTISYEVRCGEKLLESVESKVLQVGAGNFDKNIESKLIGAQKGTPYSIDIPKSSEEEKLKEEKKIIIVTVEKIQYMESVELTDDFIKKNLGQTV